VSIKDFFFLSFLICFLGTFFSSSESLLLILLPPLFPLFLGFSSLLDEDELSFFFLPSHEEPDELESFFFL
jgi:hypothetical protein